MDSNQPALTSLKIVAAIFIVSGLISAFEVLLSLVEGTLIIHLGVLGLFIGRGLLRRSRGWRTFALVCFRVAFIGIPIIVLMMMSGAEIRLTLFGLNLGDIPEEFALVLGAGSFMLALWQYRVLTRPDVQELF